MHFLWGFLLQRNKTQDDISHRISDEFHAFGNFLVVVLGNADDENTACWLTKFAFAALQGFQVCFGTTLGRFQADMNTGWAGPAIDIPHLHVNDSPAAMDTTHWSLREEGRGQEREAEEGKKEA